MRHSRTEDGASSVEYGLIVFAIAAIVVITLFAFGTVTTGMFTNSCDEIRSGMNNSGMGSPSCA